EVEVLLALALSLLPLLRRAFAEGVAPDIEDRGEFRTWFENVRGSLHPDGDSKLVIDRDVLALGVPNDSMKLLEKAVAGDGESLLRRYGPKELRAVAKEARARWLEENRDYLFFSDWGGYRWYLDPVAQRLRRPTSELRGAARADRVRVREGSEAQDRRR
ncbi:MAG: hypothetical protein KC420_23070, partial [Myxococcales bacterium]|nr:hypothetical protein [Myxococcales bacterium]